MLIDALEHRTLRTKLLWGFAIVLLLMVVVVVSSFVIVARIDHRTAVIRETGFPVALAGLEIQRSIQQMVLGIEASSGSGTTEGLERAKRAHAALHEALKPARAGFAPDSEGAALIDRLDHDADAFFTLGSELVEHNLRQRWERIPPLMERYNRLSSSLVAQASALSTRGVDEMEGALKDITALTANTRRINFALGLLALAASIVLSILISLSIVRPISRLTQAAAAMARGEFNQPIQDGHANEVGILAGAFIALQEAVRDRLEELARNNEALGRAFADLERQNEELKVLDRIKDGLIRDVTHELKTPVAKFRMQTELLRDFLAQRGLSGEAEEILEVVDHSIARQEGVIRNILNLARLEGGGSRYRKSRVELAGAVAGVVREFSDLAARFGVEIRMALEPVVVDADAEILGHMILNLIDNSIKFRRPDGGGWVRIRTAVRGAMAELTVEDNGIGMTEEEQSRACERFYQGSPSSEGGGVGLTIVRRIVLDHGGQLLIKSPGKGQGTLVTVMLPQAGG